MTPVELQRRGMEILIRELGYADAVQFMLQFSQGRGDYTKERRKMLADATIDELLDATARRVNAAKRPSGRRRRSA